MMMKTICVVGMGYIGLPVACMLAGRGNTVVGFDINAAAVESINQGRSHFVEPDLDMLLSAAVQTGRLSAQSSACEADYFIIAVPTPFREGHKPDLSYIDAATHSIAPFLRRGVTIILESTSPVGTTERLSETLANLRRDLRFPKYKDNLSPVDVHIAHCPERILPGKMVQELVTNDRIIGGVSENCGKAAVELYSDFVTASMYLTDCRTAEFVKLIENSFRDVNIAFANEVSTICERLGIDVWAAISLANKHPRVSILRPGAGVGGHCIAVDPWFIVDSAPVESRLIRLAREVNDGKPNHVVSQILLHAERFKAPVITCFGLTYKPDVGDLRESPSVKIVSALSNHPDLRVLVCDPTLDCLPADLQHSPNVKFVGSDEGRAMCDIAVFLVDHKQFQSFEPSAFMSKIVVDPVGLLSRSGVSRL